VFSTQPRHCGLEPLISNKGLAKERQEVVFINKWSLFGGHLIFHFINEGLSKGSLYVQGYLYSEVVFNTDSIVIFQILVFLFSKSQ
jgi:hypothetical protein